MTAPSDRRILLDRHLVHLGMTSQSLNPIPTDPCLHPAGHFVNGNHPETVFGWGQHSPWDGTICKGQTRFNSKDPESLSLAIIGLRRLVVECRTHTVFRKRCGHSGLHKLHSSVAESELCTQPHIKMGFIRSKTYFSSNNRPILLNNPYVIQSRWLLFHPQPQRGTTKHTSPYLPSVQGFLPKAKRW